MERAPSLRPVGDPTAGWDFSSREAEVLAAIPRLLAPLRPQRIVLFGSRADGTARPDSDFDLLVVTETHDPARPPTVAARRLLRRLRVPLDVIVYTPDEWEAFRHHPQAFAREIDRRGKVLLGAA